MKVDKSKFICELDSYKYYLGDVIASGVDWFTAKEMVDRLGEGWELPSREVAIVAHNKFREEMSYVYGWYWLRDEYSSSHAWVQGSATGFQSRDCKPNTPSNCVRPVYKEKVKTGSPKIKLLKVMGFSDLVLDIDGKKVLYELGENSVLNPDLGISKGLSCLDEWYYTVISEDFLQWLYDSKNKREPELHKKIYHIREKDEDGNILPRGGVTIVFVENNGWFDGYIALCHPDDNYNKKVGVEVALSKKPCFKTPEVVGVIVNNTTPSYWKRLAKSLSK